MAGSCRYCGCTDHAACEDGCSWADDAQTLCTQCELAVEFSQATLPVLAMLSVKVQAGPPFTWTDLSTAHQQLLVMSYRAICDGIREQFIESIGEDAANAVVDLATLASVLYQKFPEDMKQADADGDPPVAVAIELLEKLEKATTNRIVLPH